MQMTVKRSVAEELKMSRPLLVAVCLMAALLLQVSADEAACAVELKKCHTPQMADLNYAAMIASPDQAIALVCHDNVLREEAEAFACGARTLKKEVCNVPSMAMPKAIFGGMQEGRIEAALRYACNNVDALKRVGQCVRTGVVQAEAVKCQESPKMRQLMEALSQGVTLSRADTCAAFSVAAGCINRSVYPECHEADLKVVRNLMTDIMPDGCITTSASGHVTANAAILMLAAVVVKIGIL